LCQAIANETQSAKANNAPQNLAISNRQEKNGGRCQTIFPESGPSLVTGAPDDDPGIRTYSQGGAQFGYGMLWKMVLSYPLMVTIQEIGARFRCLALSRI
jgi:Mn2+/Fe2+ NRAMP family transporter